jgi:hypothetical protein
MTTFGMGRLFSKSLKLGFSQIGKQIEYRELLRVYRVLANFGYLLAQAKVVRVCPLALAAGDSLEFVLLSTFVCTPTFWRVFVVR